MKLSYWLLILTAILGYQCRSSPEEAEQGATNQALLDSLDQQRITLPNGWSLTPVGASVSLGDLPLNMAVSHDKKHIAITNNGQSTQSIMLYGVGEQRILDSVEIAVAWVGTFLCSRRPVPVRLGGQRQHGETVRRAGRSA